MNLCRVTLSLAPYALCLHGHEHRGHSGLFQNDFVEEGLKPFPYRSSPDTIQGWQKNLSVRTKALPKVET
jgi:hypothetical protein